MAFFLYVIHLVRGGGYGLASNMSEYGCTPMCVFGVFFGHIPLLALLSVATFTNEV